MNIDGQANAHLWPGLLYTQAHTPVSPCVAAYRDTSSPRLSQVPSLDTHAQSRTLPLKPVVLSGRPRRNIYEEQAYQRTHANKKKKAVTIQGWSTDVAGFTAC